MHMTTKETLDALDRILDTLDAGRPSASVFMAKASALNSAAVTLSRVGERECNGVRGPDGYMKWDESDQAWADRERAAAQTRALHALRGVMDYDAFERLDVEFQGDPRGPSIVVHVKSGPQRVAVFY